MPSIDPQAPTRESAEALLLDKHYPEAIEAFRELLDRNPTSAPLMKGIGMALTMSGNPAEGVEFCRKAAVLQPIEADYRYAYGYALGALRRFEEAIPELDAAVQLKPDHSQAKQALTYCLVTQAKADAAADPDKAGAMFERARLLAPQNADLTAALLGHYVSHGCQDKAVELAKNLDGAVAQHPAIQQFLSQIASTQPKAMAGSSAMPGAPVVDPNAPKQVPCPKCGMPIMDYAAICPHCGFKNRQTGTFAGRDRGPDRNWQEVAYTIMAGLWTLLGVIDVVNALNISMEMLRQYALVLAVVRVGIGIGLLARQEWIAMIAKIICYLTLFSSGYMTMVGFAIGRPLIGIGSLFSLFVAGFMVYLINYEMD